MILKMYLEIETKGMTLIQLAALVDSIKYLSGIDGRVKCSLPRNTPRDVDVSELLTEPAMR